MVKKKIAKKGTTAKTAKRSPKKAATKKATKTGGVKRSPKKKVASRKKSVKAAI